APDQTLLCLEGFITDITERKHAEERLRESERRFRSLFNLSSDWYWESDAELRFARFDGRDVERADSPFRGLIGRRVWESDLYLANAADNAEAQRELLERRLTFYDVIMCTPLADGSPLYISVSGEPRFDAAGRFLGYHGIGRDITKRMRDERAMLRLGRMYAAISATNEAILRVQAPEELYQKVCDAAVHGGEFIATGVMLFEPG